MLKRLFAGIPELERQVSANAFTDYSFGEESESGGDEYPICEIMNTRVFLYNAASKVWERQDGHYRSRSFIFFEPETSSYRVVSAMQLPSSTLEDQILLNTPIHTEMKYVRSKNSIQWRDALNSYLVLFPSLSDCDFFVGNLDSALAELRGDFHFSESVGEGDVDELEDSVTNDSSGGITASLADFDLPDMLVVDHSQQTTFVTADGTPNATASVAAKEQEQPVVPQAHTEQPVAPPTPANTDADFASLGCALNLDDVNLGIPQPESLDESTESSVAEANDPSDTDASDFSIPVSEDLDLSLCGPNDVPFKAEEDTFDIPDMNAAPTATSGTGDAGTESQLREEIESVRKQQGALELVIAQDPKSASTSIKLEYARLTSKLKTLEASLSSVSVSPSQSGLPAQGARVIRITSGTITKSLVCQPDTLASDLSSTFAAKLTPPLTGLDFFLMDDTTSPSRVVPSGEKPYYNMATSSYAFGFRDAAATPRSQAAVGAPHTVPSGASAPPVHDEPASSGQPSPSVDRLSRDALLGSKSKRKGSGVDRVEPVAAPSRSSLRGKAAQQLRTRMERRRKQRQQLKQVQGVLGTLGRDQPDTAALQARLTDLEQRIADGEDVESEHKEVVDALAELISSAKPEADEGEAGEDAVADLSVLSSVLSELGQETGNAGAEAEEEHVVVWTFARATYDFDPEEAEGGEGDQPAEQQYLSMVTGDIVVVLDQTEEVWWYGFIGEEHNEGYFPADHVVVITEEEAYADEIAEEAYAEEATEPEGDADPVVQDEGEVAT